MTTLADLVSVVTRPDTAESILRVRHHGYKLLGGAALYDLVDRGRLALSGEGRGARVVLRDPAPVPEPSLEYGLSRVRSHSSQWPRNAVLRLGGGVRLRQGIHGGLAAEGVLGDGRKPGLFSPARYPVLDLQRRDRLIGLLHATLVAGQQPDEAIRRLAALLAIGDEGTGPLLDIVLHWPGAGAPPAGPALQAARAQAKRNGLEVAKTDWIALSTLQTLLLP